MPLTDIMKFDAPQAIESLEVVIPRKDEPVDRLSDAFWLLRARDSQGNVIEGRIAPDTLKINGTTINPEFI